MFVGENVFGYLVVKWGEKIGVSKGSGGGKRICFYFFCG